MIHESSHAGYLLSDDPARLSLEVIHRYLSEESYWAAHIPREIVARSLENSLGIGIYAPTGEQVGFARVISDFATYAWLCDVFVHEDYRGKGVGKWLMATIISHPDLHDLRRIMLATRDAHGLYSQFGFTSMNNPERWMERFNA